jgi:alkanesulfonate monooxygenase SsuD/methylene tetrahydromethanopterin reductase-like flavin-dependent oxidoreductase (luciferase family)
MTTLREGQKATVKANIEAAFFDAEGKVTDHLRRLLDNAIDQVLMVENHTLEDAEEFVQHFQSLLVIKQHFNMTLRAK